MKRYRRRLNLPAQRQYGCDLSRGAFEVFAALGEGFVQRGEGCDGGEDGGKACVGQRFRARAKHAREGNHRHIVLLRAAQYAERHFAEAGLSVDAAFAGDDEVGVGQRGIYPRRLHHQVDAGGEARAEQGERVAEAARRAPRASGALAASFHTEPTTATIKTRDGTSRRASGRVIADVPHAAATEFGHATQAGTPVPGAHTLGLLAAAKSARGRRRT